MKLISILEVERFLKAFTEWATSEPDIQAVALVGSYARHTATESSDVDLVILAQHPNRYLNDTGWASRFGGIQRQQIEPYGKLISLRVWYMGGMEVEYGLTDENWAATPLDEGTRRVIADGMRVLLDRDKFLSHPDDETLE